MGTLIFKDKNNNQGTVEGINATDYATLNDLIEAVNIIGQSSSARNFINSLLKTDLSNLSSNIANNANILMAHNAMPSNVYDELTLGASGSSYIAPADGMFHIAKQGMAGESLSLRNNNAMFDVASMISLNTSAVAIYIFAKKGDVVTVNYSASLTLFAFKFIYAVGSESEKA